MGLTKASMCVHDMGEGPRPVVGLEEASYMADPVPYVAGLLHP